MDDTKRIIIPDLPENLRTLFEQEEKNLKESVAKIFSYSSLEDHLKIIYKSLNIIFDFTISYKNRNDNELVMQYLGIRLFNSTTVALKLLLYGYYQNSVMHQRDVLEAGFLIDYLSTYDSKIQEWKESSRENRLKNYNPRVIREALDKRDGIGQSKRYEIYTIMCEYAAHPTFKGNKLVAP